VTCWLRAATCSAPRARPVHSPLRASALSPLSWTAEATAGTSDKNAVRLAPCLAQRQRSVRCCFSLQNQLSSSLRLSPCPSALPRQTVQFRRHSGQGRARRNPAPIRPSFTLCPGSHPSPVPVDVRVPGISQSVTCCVAWPVWLLSLHHVFKGHPRGSRC
jgi:hypothetical protein